MNSIPLSILLIEDDRDDLALIQEALSERNVSVLANCRLESALSLEEGLKVLAAGEFNLILLDITLPGNRGLEAFNKIRLNHPDLPIIVLTTDDDETLGLQAVSHGAQDYLVKHAFNAHLLKRSIAYALERHQLLQRLERSSEERFRQFIEKSADGLFVVGLDGIVKYINPAVESLFERSSSDIIGKKFDFHILARQDFEEDGPLDQLTLKYISLLAKTGKMTELEISLAGDLIRLVEMRANEIQWGKRPAFLVVFHDITSLMRLQRLKAEIFERERVAKLKDEFISTVSHELRTPLAIVKCAIENMKDGVTGPLSDKQDKIVKIASSNVDRLTKLIDDILDLSRLEAGRVRISCAPLVLDQLVQDTVRRFTIMAGEQGIALNVQVLGDLPAIEADADKVTQILDNLLSNALRFAQKNVTLQLQRVSRFLEQEARQPETLMQLKEFVGAGKDAILVSVIDDGPGIPADKVDHLFNKFVQLDRPTGGAGYKGTGLGLAICKEIVDLHNGKVWADSEYGMGAKFRFVLPQFQGQPVQAPLTAESAETA